MRSLREVVRSGTTTPMTARSSRPDLRHLAETAAAANSTARLAFCELLLIALNVGACAGALVCRQSGSRWTGLAALLAVVETVSLLPLLVGVHWATTTRVSRRWHHG